METLVRNDHNVIQPRGSMLDSRTFRACGRGCPLGLDELVSSGSLELSDGIYSLTERGKTDFEIARDELFLKPPARSKTD